MLLAVDSFAEHELELALVPELELAFSLTFDTAVEHTFAVAECKAVVVACSWDFQKSFAVDERQQL